MSINDSFSLYQCILNPRGYNAIETVRYQITAVTRQVEAFTAIQKTLGWRVYVTDAPVGQLTLEQAVFIYRGEWSIERGFHRLKGIPLSLTPLSIHHDDQGTGLTYLLSIADR